MFGGMNGIRMPEKNEGVLMCNKCRNRFNASRSTTNPLGAIFGSGQKCPKCGSGDVRRDPMVQY